jgi:hypothetical protein
VEEGAAAERTKFERLGVELGRQTAQARTNLFEASEAHAARVKVMEAVVYTRPLLSSTQVVSDTKCTLDTP